METAVTVIQVVVALGIFNVWMVRPGKASPWRGGSAANMKEEFAAYGLPDWSMQVVGFLKLACAVGLIVGIWFPVVTRPAAILLGVLMMGAIAMHVKVNDPLKKSVPAFTMLVLCVVIAAF
jgi:hypothetical protein